MVNTQMEISGGTEPPLSETPWHLALLGWRFSCTSLTDLPCSRTHQSGRHSSKARTAGWETQPGLGVGGNMNEWETLTNLLDLGSTAGAG